jgi:putative flippase GtrA
MHEAPARPPRLHSSTRATLGRVLRCLAVSGATTGLSSLILVLLAIGLGVPAGAANVVAFSCGIPVSYFANRRWGWHRRGRSDPVREVGAFWVLNIAGLVVSTFAVGAAGELTASWPSAWRAIALPVASAATLGVLWVVQFVLMDRVIFRAPVSASLTHEIRGEVTPDRGWS